MKKILLVLSMILLTLSSLDAKMPTGQKYTLKHANPMPNLMRIVVGNAEILNVTPKQLVKIKIWMKASKPKIKAMINKVVTQEAILLESALTTDNDSAKEAKEMLDTRLQIITMKTKCRETLKSILTKEQYVSVIKIYRSVR